MIDQFKRVVALAALCGPLAMTGCDDGDSDTGAGGAGGGEQGDCPDGTTADGTVCILQGEVTTDTRLTPDKEYLLRGGVFVGNDVDETVLTIDAGVTIYGETSSKGMLVIRRGSKIMAEGTAQAPIVMTSPNLEGSRARGDWGGLIINGRAPVNGCDAAPCEAEGEGGTGKFGGADADDSSGVLRYVRVEYAGNLLSEDNELNGITFQGVGRGTVVDYIQVHMNKDDGVEFFGGTVDIKHVLLTGIGDDSLDWTDGWRGRGQFIAAVQYDDAGDQGIEADNNGENNDAEPRSEPILTNLTILGSGGENSDLGVLLREGTGAWISNMIVANFGEACFAIDHNATFGNAWDAEMLSGALAVNNSLLFCPDSANFVEPELDGAPFTVEGFWGLNAANQIGDPMLANWTLADPALSDMPAPDLVPLADSIVRGAGDTPDDSFFEQTDYIGAFGDADWTAGWTNWDAN